MQFHYALVDDLMTREEFERRIEEKVETCGDLVDEPTAAMMVVQELGRHHVKVKDLAGPTSLFSFFCKVIAKRPPKEFDRKEGEKGLVASLFVGDDTGSTQLVFWDEKAMAVGEIDIGDVLEIIGRHAGKSTRDITVMAFRKAEIEISCSITADALPEEKKAERVDLRVRLIALEGIRTFTRKDGNTGEMVEAVVGDAEGTARLVSWEPDLLVLHEPGSCIAITGAKVRPDAQGREYSLDGSSQVAACDEEIVVPLAPLSDLVPDGTFSVEGTITRTFPPKSFTTRSGNGSQVRNLILSDGDRSVRLVLWGDQVQEQVVPGDRVGVYQARAKSGRTGGLELHAGRGSALVIRYAESEDIAVTGTCLHTGGAVFLDTGEERYLVNADLPHGRELRVTGMRAGSRITPARIEPADPDPGELAARLEALKQKLEAPPSSP